MHRDDSTPMAVICMLFDAGSRDEDPERTGLAHLFEHLMFGGSVNIPSYDREVQKAGGENNAFTNNDVTGYYINLPSANLETGFWLESDRMLGLRLTQKRLDIQKNVVIEEYKQRYLNQPYGDIWLLLRPLAYKTHPYRWPAIGSDISHIEKISLEEAENFFNQHYCPSNAILSIAGNVDEDRSFKLVEKWFGSVEKRGNSSRDLPAEPPQDEARQMKVIRDVPYDEIIMAFHMCSRNSPAYYASDLISDLLAGGRSSRLYRRFVMDKRLFSNINAYITGDADPGLFIIRARLIKGIEMKRAYDEILGEINLLVNRPPGKHELTRVKNKLEATRQYSHTEILNKACDLAYYELLGDAGDLNSEIMKYRSISPQEIQETAKSIFNITNSSVIFYYSRPKKPES